MSKKMVFKTTMENERSKIKAMKAVAGSGGKNLHYFIVYAVDSIEINIEEGKITAVGVTDPVYLAKKLRKLGHRVELVSVGPAKEEKKDDKKEETPNIVYHVNSDGYGYPTYSIYIDDYYSSGYTIL